jgi:SepF-like predicted cell division protein (DUF552 family)
MNLDFLKGTEDDDSNQEEINELVELDATTKSSDSSDMKVAAETISEFDDVEEVQEKLRSGMTVWVNIGPVKSGDMGDLKRAVNRLKKTVSSIDGDMAGVDEDYIIACPDDVEIVRE